MITAEINLLYFAPVFLLLYWFTRKNLWVNNLVLLLTGYLLYAWGDPAWALLLFLLTVVNYYLVKTLFASSKYRRIALLFALLINIGAWLASKYSHVIAFPLGFPLGISFYTLRQIAYLVDTYRGKFRTSCSFKEYALYVSFYPQIFSGPIERPDDFIRQLKEPRDLDLGMVARALSLILMGFFKKIVIADNLSMIVDRIFRLDYPSRLMLAVGSLGFTFEIYADFSGYTDISRGFSTLLGFETSRNFNKPYIALTPQDFWNKWHITFSTWLRDYVFFPLRRWILRAGGGNVRWLADWVTPVATMLVSGLWHGTGWNFLLWGLYYGVLLAICQVSGWSRVSGQKVLVRFIAWAVNFALIVLGWMIFRAPSVDWLIQTIRYSPWGASGNQLIALLSVFTMIVIYIIPIIIKLLIDKAGRMRSILEPAYYAFALVILIIFAASGMQDFVYTTF
jgi:D-alanyl-lipoteichoic acid acyltransferase DltB (MBOAT superfamily)